MNQYNTLAYKEGLARRKKVNSGDVPLDQILKELFEVNLSTLSENPEWGQITQLHKRISNVLHVSVSAVKGWHSKDSGSGRMEYFAKIPPDRLASLRYYYCAIHPTPHADSVR